MVAGAAGAAAARADTRVALIPRLTLGAGYDDNLFLDANPSGALPSQIRSDAIFDVEPALRGELGAGRHSFALSLDYLERITPANGDLRDLAARLDWRSPELGPIRLALAGLYEHYQAEAFPDDTFDRGGGEAGARLTAGRHVSFAALYRFDARAYPDPTRSGQLDLEQLASAALRLQLHARLGAELAYTFLHIGSNNPTAALDRHRGDLAVTARPVSWLLLAADGGLAWQRLPNGQLPAGEIGPRADLLEEASVSITAQPLAWLELFARYDFIHSASTAETGAWQRNQALGGIILRYDLERRFVHPPPLAPTVRAHLVTFRYQGAATRVSVIGDWNGWDPSAAPLARTGEQRFEAAYTLPPGRHEYVLVVDGANVIPPDAPAYVSDGFGGKNGVVEVP
jgi:hypothetical protein